MAKRTSQYVQIGKRRLELSNLNKVLYPDDQIIKAEMVQYYLQIAPTILTHIKGRALSLIRFPEGIEGEGFFQKNRPEWAPDWVEFVRLGSEEKKEYIMATEDAVLVWLANLACLELHQMHARRPHFDKPDYFVLDIDPPEGYPFDKVVEIALNLKDHAESFGYHPFAKTTGGKGIHIYVPVETKWSFNEVFEAASDLAKPFVEENNETTLNIKKDARKGRVLIDIYRNRTSQTIVSAYSLRGKPGAPVSMPLTWEELEKVKNPLDYNIHNTVDKVIGEGDAWEGIASYAVPLHTQRPTTHVKELPKSEKHKTPEQLKEYAAKRDFEKTREPKGEEVLGTGNSFVIHRHHATRLHYDLRLEEDGVLKSWAVPKGMPQRPGIKRLAVQTEDHPLEYLTFEGSIPKGEYGAGNMWVYATGKYEYTKKKKDGFYILLHGKQIEAEYRMHRTKEKEWLLERVDQPQVDWLERPVQPMLAELAEDIPESGNYLYEVKWDGIRALISIDEGRITIHSRNGNDISKCFPELLIPEQAFRATNGLFDGEIVCPDEDGRPNFHKVIQRLKTKGDASISKNRSKLPAFCYLFDCLYLDGRLLINEPLVRRREWLADSIKKNTPYRLSEAMEEGHDLFEAAKKLHMEGIMAKEKNSRYTPGKRNNCWVKVKVRKTTETLIIGFTKGKGDRDSWFGALHLAAHENGKLVYKGKVGTGFDHKTLKEVHGELQKCETTKRPVKEKPADDAQSVWISPFLVCEIQFSSVTENNTYREPVFIRLRLDLVPENVDSWSGR
jgi:bifunctional non-homologous end joining protein LigD